MLKIRSISTPAYTSVSGTIGSTAAHIDSITGRQGAFITIEDAPVRYWYDGATPTQYTGHLLLPGQSLEINHPTCLANLLLVSADGSTAKYMASLY